MTPLQGRLVVIAALVVLVGWGMEQLFAIHTIRVQSPARGPEIQSEAVKIVDSGWQWGNLITFDNGGFVAKLQQVDPILRGVSVRRSWLHTIVITATLKQPSLGWSTGNQMYVIDRDGTVIGAATAMPGLPVVYDGSNLPLSVGQQAVSARFIEFVSHIVPALAANGITVSRLDIKDTTFDLTATTNKGYRLLFDTSREAGDEISDLKSVQALLATQKRTPAEYIDLRVSGKAYYK
jgi:cell division septal protein FtsQ